MYLHYNSTTDHSIPFDFNQCKILVSTYYSKCCCGLYVVLTHKEKVLSLQESDLEALCKMLETLHHRLYQLPTEQVDYEQAQAIAKKQLRDTVVALSRHKNDHPITMVAYTDVKSSQCAITKDAMMDDIYHQFQEQLQAAIQFIEAHKPHGK